VTVSPADDAPRPDAGEGFSDAVTVAFGDARADLFGIARLGLADGGASGMTILFHRGEPVEVRAEGGVGVGGRPTSWNEVSAAGLDTEVVEPLRAWRLHYASDDATLDLDLRAVGAVATLDPESPVARAGGMAGFDQAVRVTGGATVRGQDVAVDGRGQRGHSWGAPDWDRIRLARTVGAWLDDDLSVALTAIRPSGGKHHEDERVAATILDRDPESGEARATAVVEPRLSTTYDADGRQTAAGLELFVDEESFPRRAAGEVRCGTTLDLGGLQLHCAFFTWRMEGRTGVGRYDVLARADGS
jgi:hypothetical protein